MSPGKVEIEDGSLKNLLVGKIKIADGSLKTILSGKVRLDGGILKSIYTSVTVPVFNPTFGTGQRWNRGVQITPIVVPEATENPVYSVVGRLPNGILFNSRTRRITGTPTVAGSGTIRIRATNSAGTADYTIGYGISIPSNKVVLNLPNNEYGTARLRPTSFSALMDYSVWDWSGGEDKNRPNMGNVVTTAQAYLFTLRIQRQGNNGHVILSLTPNRDDGINQSGAFTTTFLTQGSITLTDANNRSVRITPGSDRTPPYLWYVTNAIALRDWAIGVHALTNRAITVTFDDNSGTNFDPPAPPTTPVNPNPPTPTTETVTLTLTAETNGSNIGAFGQHRTPIPAGRISPREFTINSKTYGIRGWFITSTNNLQINMDSQTQEDNFRTENLEVDLGNGETFDTSELRNVGGVLVKSVTNTFVSGQQYTVTIKVKE